MMKTKEDVLKEVNRQLAMFLLSHRRSIDWLENESKMEMEYAIASLAKRIGYSSTSEMLEAEFQEYVTFFGDNHIEAGPKLYDTPELQHIISLQERTVLKERNKPKSRASEYVKSLEPRRPRHFFGNDENSTEVLIRKRRIRIIEELPPRRRSERIIEKKKKSLPPAIAKRSKRPPRLTTFRLDARKTAKPDLLDNIVALTKSYGYGKPSGRLTSLHLANSTVPAIVDWAWMLKRISNITSKNAKVTLVNDVTPNWLFLNELYSSYGIYNKGGATYFDEETGKTYFVCTGVLKSRRYRISFLINNN